MEAKSTYWNAQSALWERIDSVGGLGAYASSLTGIRSAFEPADRSLRCIDERVPGGVNIAGSGILLDEAVLIGRLRNAGVDGVFSHAECGAAKLHATQKGLDVARADEYGRAFAERIAGLLGVPYRGHLDVQPSGLHVARVVYYDGTGSFDPSRHAGLPPGFVVSRKYHDVGYALEEVKVAVSIARGDHGFGDLISAASPLNLVAIGTTMSEADAFRAELASVQQKDPAIRVDAFVAPRLT